MRVTIIGSGNVATILGRRMQHAGHIIHQVYSRTQTHAETLAYEISAAAVNDLQQVDQSADIYVISVSDKALEVIVQNLRLPSKLVVHTAGSVSVEVLEKVSDHYGVLYPLQTMRKELPAPFLPMLTDANNAWNKAKLMAFARTFADQVNEANDEQRSKLHVAAVISNNFTNYLFALAEDYCKKEGVDFKLLLPLFEETAKRLAYASPKDVQTGPAIRNDEVTMKKHREMLQEHSELLELYGEFSKRIRESEKLKKFLNENGE